MVKRSTSLFTMSTYIRMNMSTIMTMIITTATDITTMFTAQ